MQLIEQNKSFINVVYFTFTSYVVKVDLFCYVCGMHSNSLSIYWLNVKSNFKYETIFRIEFDDVELNNTTGWKTSQEMRQMSQKKVKRKSMGPLSKIKHLKPL